MNPITIMTAIFFISISFILIKAMEMNRTGFNLKSVTVKNKFLVKALIPKKRGYVKVADRNKVSLFSLLFFILLVILVIFLVIMLIVPDIPCETFTGIFRSRGALRIKWEIHTLNEKLIYLLPLLFIVLQLIGFFVLGLIAMIKNKTKSKKTICGIVAFILFLAACLAYLFFELF